MKDRGRLTIRVDVDDGAELEVRRADLLLEAPGRAGPAKDVHGSVFIVIGRQRKLAWDTQHDGGAIRADGERSPHEIRPFNRFTGSRLDQRRFKACLALPAR